MTSQHRYLLFWNGDNPCSLLMNYHAEFCEATNCDIVTSFWRRTPDVITSLFPLWLYWDILFTSLTILSAPDFIYVFTRPRAMGLNEQCEFVSTNTKPHGREIPKPQKQHRVRSLCEIVNTTLAWTPFWKTNGFLDLSMGRISQWNEQFLAMFRLSGWIMDQIQTYCWSFTHRWLVYRYSWSVFSVSNYIPSAPAFGDIFYVRKKVLTKK